MKLIMQARRALAARRRQDQKGLTLIEAAMVLGVAALVIAGVLVLYSQANTSNKTSEALNQLNIVQQAVRNVYGGSGDFSTLVVGDLIAAKVLPAKMINAAGTGLSNAFNGAINIQPSTDAANAPGGFEISFTGIPADACVTLGTKDYGRSMASLVTDSGSLFGVGQNGVATPANAGLACPNTSNTLTWLFMN